MELGPRDRLSQAFVKELERGRTIETPYGHVVHLDLRHLGEKKINAKIPFVRELCLQYQNLDPVTELIPVRPVVHYMMGGVHTDIHGATPLPGLFAAGEAACVSINGANRLGSNSLPELLVFGARAGRAAAEHASHGRDVSASVVAQAERRAPAARARSAQHDRATSASPTSATACTRRWSRARASTDQAQTLTEAVQQLQRLRERCDRRGDRGPQPNVQHRARGRAGAGVHARHRRGDRRSRRTRARNRAARTSASTSRRVTTSASLRTRLISRRSDGSTRVEYLPVTITRWPPGERVYGEAAPHAGPRSRCR